MCWVLRKTLGLWLDSYPAKILITSNGKHVRNLRNIWNLIQENGNEFEIDFEREPISSDSFEVINFQPRKFNFKCESFKLVLTKQSNLSFRLVKKLILLKMMIEETCINFELNEAIYDDRSRMSSILINIETIKLILFHFKDQVITFRYSGNAFDLNLSNDRDFNEVEAEIRYKIGL
jgi:hypothetical protein